MTQYKNGETLVKKQPGYGNCCSKQQNSKKITMIVTVFQYCIHRLIKRNLLNCKIVVNFDEVKTYSKKYCFYHVKQDYFRSIELRMAHFWKAKLYAAIDTCQYISCDSVAMSLFKPIIVCRDFNKKISGTVKV